MDKKLFSADSVIGLKNPEKSFPLNNDVGVLKWRLQTTDESLIPLTSKIVNLKSPSQFYRFLSLVLFSAACTKHTIQIFKKNKIISFDNNGEHFYFTVPVTMVSKPLFSLRGLIGFT